jgi:hypothetical protein
MPDQMLLARLLRSRSSSQIALSQSRAFLAPFPGFMRSHAKGTGFAPVSPISETHFKSIAAKKDAAGEWI